MQCNISVIISTEIYLFIHRAYLLRSGREYDYSEPKNESTGPAAALSNVSPYSPSYTAQPSPATDNTTRPSNNTTTSTTTRTSTSYQSPRYVRQLKRLEKWFSVSCTCGLKEKLLSIGVEPLTFWFSFRSMLYHWDTEDSWKLTALIKTRFMNKTVLQTARAGMSICAYAQWYKLNINGQF